MRSLSWKRDLIPLLIVVLPYGFYQAVVVGQLEPVPVADTAAYLWDGPINVAFFANRSVTQRILYTLCSSNANRIVAAQLWLFAAVAICLYFLLRRRNLGFNLVLALVIAFLFSSYTFNVMAVILNPEPVHTALLVLFPFALFLGSQKGRWGWVFPCAIGLLLIGARSTAPLVVITLIGCHAIFAIRAGYRQPIVLYGFLVAVSVLRFGATLSADTAVHINVVNNLFMRVFPHTEATDLFHQKYGMPRGSYVDACSGGNVNSPCFAGHKIYRFNEESRNYELIDDHFGFSQWVRRRGSRSWSRYILLHRPIQTLIEFSREFDQMVRSLDVRFLIFYLGLDRRSDPDGRNLEILTHEHSERARGFLGFDSITLIKKMLWWIGFGFLPILIMYLFGGITLMGKSDSASTLPLACSMLIAAVVLAFVSFYGDAMELQRHTYPAMILYSLGGLLFVGSVAEGLKNARVSRDRLKS